MTHAFQLAATTEVNCSHVNLREEVHGEEKVRAADLTFWMEGSNDLLELFHPDLRKAMYCNKAADQGQEELDEDIAILPNLRVVGLPEKIRFGGDDKYSGYRAIIDYGLGDAQSNIDLTGCVVGKKWFTAKEGGTVRIGWRVSYVGEALEDVLTRGKVTGLMGQKAFLVLNPPPVLQLVKPGKKAKDNQPPANEEDSTDLLGDGEPKGDGAGADTPQAAMQRAHGA